MDENGFLQVYGHLNEVAHAATFDRLLSAGEVIERVDETGMLVKVSVPVSRVAETADLDEGGHISLPNYGRTNIGSLRTQGDSLLNFEGLRASFGVLGAG
jgi:hypothetical protein